MPAIFLPSIYPMFTRLFTLFSQIFTLPLYAQSKSTVGKAMRRLNKAKEFKGFASGQRGLTLMETLVALAILAIVAVVFLNGLAISSKSVLVANERSTAESLAKSQMEYVKRQNYDDTNNPPQYALLSDIPAGYDIGVTAARLDPEGDGTLDDNSIQGITVTVNHETKKVIILEDYKVNPN